MLVGFIYEVYAYGIVEVMCEYAFGEAQKHGGFTDVRVTDEEQLQEAVTKLTLETINTNYCSWLGSRNLEHNWEQHIVSWFVY